jgi:hypothetical protein
VDRVHSTGASVHRTSLNVSPSSSNLWPGLNELKGYPVLLILAIDAGTDDPRWRLTRVSRYWCSGPPFLMRSSPKGVAWGGDSPRGGGSWAVMVTGAVHVTGCSSSSSSTTVRASSRGAPAHPRPRATSPWSPRAPPRLQLQCAVANQSSSKFLLSARVWFLRIKIQGK